MTSAVHVQPSAPSRPEIHTAVRVAFGLTLIGAIANQTHSRDDHCDLGDDGACVVCGVHHGDRCGSCGQCGFHADGCEEVSR
jgi:hypothetical protein